MALQWVLVGYSLAFGPDSFKGLIGGFQFVGLKGVGAEPNAFYAATIPHQLFMVYQLMFAVITPALISGAFAERMKFSAYVLFTLLWSTLVYDPVAHWVWGPAGWIKELGWGRSTSRGGWSSTSSPGIAALCCVLVMGKRKNLGTEEMHPAQPHHDRPGDGACSGSAGSGSTPAAPWRRTASAVAAFVNTNTAAAAAVGELERSSNGCTRGRRRSWAPVPGRSRDWWP